MDTAGQGYEATGGWFRKDMSSNKIQKTFGVFRLIVEGGFSTVQLITI